jgi:hypothetical protein
MKTMLLAAAAGLSLVATAAAYADGGEGPAANTLFTQLPGVVAQAELPRPTTYTQNLPVQTQQAQAGQEAYAYGTRSSRGTWLFAPNANQGANS